jgi:hypothetical protein
MLPANGDCGNFDIPVDPTDDIAANADFAGLESSKGWVDTQQPEHEWIKYASRQYLFCSLPGQMRPVIACFGAVESLPCG